MAIRCNFRGNNHASRSLTRPGSKTNPDGATILTPLQGYNQTAHDGATILTPLQGYDHSSPNVATILTPLQGYDYASRSLARAGLI